MSLTIVPTNITYTLTGSQDAEEYECEINEESIIHTSSRDDDTFIYCFTAKTPHGVIKWDVEVLSDTEGLHIENCCVDHPENIEITNDAPFEVEEVDDVD